MVAGIEDRIIKIIEDRLLAKDIINVKKELSELHKLLNKGMLDEAEQKIIEIFQFYLLDSAGGICLDSIWWIWSHI